MRKLTLVMAILNLGLILLNGWNMHLIEHTRAGYLTAQANYEQARLQYLAHTCYNE